MSKHVALVQHRAATAERQDKKADLPKERKEGSALAQKHNFLKRNSQSRNVIVRTKQPKQPKPLAKGK